MNLSWHGLAYMRVNRYTHSLNLHCDYSSLPRPFYTIATILHGNGIFEQNGNITHVSSGDVLFIPFRACYCSEWIAAPATELLSCHFLLPAGCSLLRDKRFHIQKVSNPVFFSETLERLYRLQNQEKALFSVLSQFYGMCDRLFESLDSFAVPALTPRIQAAVSYIESHYHETFTIKTLAECCQMSESHFYSCFRKEVGVSPIAYKHRIAVTAAEQLLTANDELSIERISELTGFENSSYFRRVFKSLTGCSPRDYRKQQTGL